LEKNLLSIITSLMFICRSFLKIFYVGTRRKRITILKLNQKERRS